MTEYDRISLAGTVIGTPRTGQSPGSRSPEPPRPSSSSPSQKLSGLCCEGCGGGMFGMAVGGCALEAGVCPVSRPLITSSAIDDPGSAASSSNPSPASASLSPAPSAPVSLTVVGDWVACFVSGTAPGACWVEERSAALSWCVAVAPLIEALGSGLRACASQSQPSAASIANLIASVICRRSLNMSPSRFCVKRRLPRLYAAFSPTSVRRISPQFWHGASTPTSIAICRAITLTTGSGSGLGRRASVPASPTASGGSENCGGVTPH